jgi:hypothetical protein
VQITEIADCRYQRARGKTVDKEISSKYYEGRARRESPKSPKKSRVEKECRRRRPRRGEGER